MRSMRRSAGVAFALVAGTVAITLGVAAPAVAAPSYPSWGDVQAAQANVAATQAEITKINADITELQQEEAAASKVALERGEDYLNAKNALDAATTAAKKLNSQADDAKAKATKSKQKAGQLAAQLARTGGGDLTMKLLLSGGDSADLLNSLGTASKLSETSAAIFTAAQQDANSAKSLTAQAKVAETARATKSSAAATALAAANKAAAASEARVTAQTAQQTTLTQQLASLQGTSAATQQQYDAGLAAAAAAAVKAPPRGGSGGGGSGGGGAPIGGSVGAPSGSAVAGAIAFAEAQLGKPYVLDGAGPNVWDCSGLTLKAYAAVGVYIGTHSATNQYNTMRSENRLVPMSERQAGDLLWYSTGGSTTATKYHVALYIGNQQMIEAPEPGVPVRIAAVRSGDLVPYAGRPTG